jgi:hypothetical protein
MGLLNSRIYVARRWSCSTLSKAIPREVAIQLCDEIRREKEHKLFTQCWGCVRFSKADFTKMCVSSTPDYRGCKLVNERFDKLEQGREDDAKVHLEICVNAFRK